MFDKIDHWGNDVSLKLGGLMALTTCAPSLTLFNESLTCVVMLSHYLGIRRSLLTGYATLILFSSMTQVKLPLNLTPTFVLPD